MANFTALKTAINNAIKTNGNEEITGAVLQAILDAMVETLGESAITNLENALAAEVTNRENAVGSVASDLTAEAEARAALDYQVNNRINQEEYNRQNADAALSQTMSQGFSTLGSQMNALSQAISALNAAYQNGFLYGGVVTPSSSPANGKCFYIALQGGTYTNFGGVGVVQGINILKNDNGWKVEHIYDQTTLLNEFYLLRQQVIQAITSFAPIVIEGDVTNAPDEEDLTSNAQHLLQFKNNAYSPLEFSGLGRKYLRKNIAPLSESAAFNGFVEGVTAEETLSGTPEYIFWDRMNTRFLGIKDGVYYADWSNSDNYVPASTSLVYMYQGTPYRWDGSDFSVDETEVPNLVNCLTQDMINEANTIYIIRYDYTLKEDITIPANCVLEFEGGSLSGDTLDSSNPIIIKSSLVKIFSDIQFTQSALPNILHTSWFGIKPNTDCDDIFESLLNSYYGDVNSNKRQLIIDTDITLYRPIEANFDNAGLIGAILGDFTNKVTIYSEYNQNETCSLIKLHTQNFSIENISFIWVTNTGHHHTLLSLVSKHYGQGHTTTVELDGKVDNCFFRYRYNNIAIGATGRGLHIQNCEFNNSHQNNYGTQGAIELYTTLQDYVPDSDLGASSEDQLRAFIINNNRFHSTSHFCLSLLEGEEVTTSPFKGVEFSNNYADRGNGFVYSNVNVDGLLVTNNTGLFHNASNGIMQLAGVRGLVFCDNVLHATGQNQNKGRYTILINTSEKTSYLDGFIICNNTIYSKDGELGFLYVLNNYGNSQIIRNINISNNSFINNLGNDVGILKLLAAMSIEGCVIEGNTVLKNNNEDVIYGIHIPTSIGNTTYKNIFIFHNSGIVNNINTKGQYTDSTHYINVKTEEDVYNRNQYLSLGSKNTDDNYALPLINKLTAEAKGFMAIPDFANVLYSFLGLHKKIHSLGVGTIVDTGISVNAGGGGRTLLVLCSSHTGTGAATRSAIYMIKCGYDGNNMSSYLIKESQENTNFAFSVSSNGNLQITNPNGECEYLIIGN